MVILGLGSNIGDRLGYLAAAVQQLATILQDIHLSRIFESPALLPPDATAEMNMPFLNMAVGGRTDLSPEALFAEIKNIERALGRVERCKWGPREIDIDILAMDDVHLDTPTLAIPHRELLNRDFALLPLLDVAPDWHTPGGHKASEIALAKAFKLGDTLRDTGLVIHA